MARFLIDADLKH